MLHYRSIINSAQSWNDRLHKKISDPRLTFTRQESIDIIRHSYRVLNALELAVEEIEHLKGIRRSSWWRGLRRGKNRGACRPGSED